MNFRSDIFEPALKRTGRIYTYDNDRGRAVLQNDDEVDKYIVLFAPQHYHKLWAALDFKYDNLPSNIEVLDWGCGTALATWAFLKRIQEAHQPFSKVRQITLIDPSTICIARGVRHLANLAAQSHEALPNLYAINKRFEDVKASDIYSDSDAIKIHLFSNVLDMLAINLPALRDLIASAFKGSNNVIAVSPLNFDRIEAFRLLLSKYGAKTLRASRADVEGWQYKLGTDGTATAKIPNACLIFSCKIT